MEGNKLNDMIRGVKMKHARGLIPDLKENLNLYFGHCHRSLNTKQGVTNVIDGNGNHENHS